MGFLLLRIFVTEVCCVQNPQIEAHWVEWFTIHWMSLSFSPFFMTILSISQQHTDYSLLGIATMTLTPMVCKGHRLRRIIQTMAPNSVYQACLHHFIHRHHHHLKWWALSVHGLELLAHTAPLCLLYFRQYHWPLNSDCHVQRMKMSWRNSVGLNHSNLPYLAHPWSRT